jgi:hypothetical protein
MPKAETKKKYFVKIAYFVHDLSDPAVRRRIQMLTAGGAEIVLAGFRRSKNAVETIEGIRPVDLGRTIDARLDQRVLRLAQALTTARRLLPAVAAADAFVARNLEMLALALRVRSLARSNCPITYECLDIHRLQSTKSIPGSFIRRLETSLAGRAHLLITSSPAFVREYFATLPDFRLPTMIVENKVLDIRPQSQPAGIARPPGPPWTIGWYGAIRCRKSLEILKNLTGRSNGNVKVVTAGRPAPAIFRDFDKLIANNPDISFLGPYRNPEDLESLYEKAHFSWTIDYYQEGDNSSWLLPNRLYEGGLYGAIPLALRHTETGRWLQDRSLGVLLDEPLERSLENFFTTLQAHTYEHEAAKIASAPFQIWAHDAQDCRLIVEKICKRKPLSI